MQVFMGIFQVAAVTFVLLGLSSQRIDACPDAAWENSVALTTMINDEREARSLPRLTVSPTLIALAQKHVESLDIGGLPTECNGHSWNTIADVSACCYTSDHLNANCMWNKPKELSQNWSGQCQPVSFTGYEISHSGDWTYAMSGWIASPSHSPLILTTGGWAVLKMVGCGAGSSTSHCWFSTDAVDPNTPDVTSDPNPPGGTADAPTPSTPSTPEETVECDLVTFILQLLLGWLGLAFCDL